MLCEENFSEIYDKDLSGISFSSYRICPIGAYSDQNLVKITGFAINNGIHIAYKPKHNGVVEMSSLQSPKRAQWHIRKIGEKTGGWEDYLRGATWALENCYPLTTGVSGLIEESLPIGGLFSFAAVILAFLEGLREGNGIHLEPPQELIDTAFDAEKNYVDVNERTPDQSCEVLSKKGHLLYLDCKDNDYKLIPTHTAMKPYQIAVFFSGLEHGLAGSKYNMRVDELRFGMYALQAFAGLDYGKFNDANARNVSFEIYQAYKDRLSVRCARCCEHRYTEFKCVEAGSPEQIKLYEIMGKTGGINSGRFSSAGFKGCCMALIDPSKADAIREEMERKYLTAFPETTGKYSFHLCESADGAGQRYLRYEMFDFDSGYASRLYHLTENYPKPLLEVGEKTILDCLVDDIDTAGLVDTHVVISNHKFDHHFEKWTAEKPQSFVVVDDGTSSNDTRLRAVCDVQYAIKKLELDDDMLVIAGDNVLDFSLVKFVAYARNEGTSCIMRYLSRMKRNL